MSIERTPNRSPATPPPTSGAVRGVSTRSRALAVAGLALFVFTDLVEYSVPIGGDVPLRLLLTFTFFGSLVMLGIGLVGAAIEANR